MARWLTRCKGCCGPVAQRYVIVIMAATGLGFVYVLRNSFSLALTQMRIKHNITKSSTKEDICPQGDDEGSKQSKKDVGEFDWNTKEAQHLISAYFYGYVVAHIPGGILSDLLGSKIVLNCGLVLSGITALLTPLSARLDYWMLFFIRVIMGLGHGVVFPGLSSLVAKWSPPAERSLMSVITYSGIMMGSAVGIALAGYILGTLPGWEPVFYIFGGTMLVWCVAFYFVGFSRPSDHPYITDREQSKIEDSIAGTSKKRPKTIPWKAIITSKATLAYVLVDFGHAWLVYFVGVQLPVYMKTVLHYNIKESGITSALPYLTMFISAMIAGFVADWMIKNKKMSITNTRKLFALMSNFLPLPFLIGASYAGCNKDVATGLFTMMMLFKGFAYASVKANPVDLSPNYAGILMAMANGAGSVGGLLLPLIVGWFIQQGEASVNDWRYTFFFSAVAMSILTVPYAFFGSGERQPFDNVKEVEETPAPPKPKPPTPTPPTPTPATPTPDTPTPPTPTPPTPPAE